MQIHELTALSGNPVAGYVFAIDTGGATPVTRRLDYALLAKALMEQYNGSSLNGQNRTVQAAFDSIKTDVHDNVYVSDETLYIKL